MGPEYANTSTTREPTTHRNGSMMYLPWWKTAPPPSPSQVPCHLLGWKLDPGSPTEP